MIPKDADPEKYAGNTVNRLREALTYGPKEFGEISKLLRHVIEDSLWKSRYDSRHHERFTHAEFLEFVTSPSPKGLETSLGELKRYCRMSEDLDTEALLEQAVKDLHPHGGDRKSEAAREKIKNDNINLDVPDVPNGTSRQQALRRLRKDRPDLHAQVLAKEKTPHAAMVEAGFRPRMIQVPADDPERAGRTLRRHYDDAAIAKLIESLIT